MKITLIAGARPNFMKVAPIIKAIKKHNGEVINGDASLNGGKDLYEKLSKMLQLADLVKFAKWHTTPDENESALTTAYDFVNETKIVNDANDANDENDVNEEEV